MRNKYVLIVASAIILVLLVVGIIVKKNPQETTTEPETEEPEQEDEENDQESDDENNNNEENQEESQPVGTYGKFIQEGEECLEVDDTLARGDCFQELSENYLDMFINEEKETFYFPFHHDQDYSDHVFYKEIDDDDQLSAIKETEYFDDYVDPHGQGDDYQRGEKALDEYWYVFSNLIPKEDREMLKYLYWTDTGELLVFAVGAKEDDVENMLLSFSHMVPSSYSSYSRYSLLHEYGHMLTVNKTQVDIIEDFFQDDLTDEQFEQLEKSCETIPVYGGCAKEDSYIYAYYEQFWSDIDDSYQEIDWEDEQEYEEFFFDNEERFFNSYQGTSLVEDIADTFSFFIHTHSDVTEKTEMKYEKIAFFYEFDELVELRADILENLYKLSVEDETYY